ncbi:MAG: flagellar basal-body MS-ring/collar protein FliF, partial [Sedimenticola sp.]
MANANMAVPVQTQTLGANPLVRQLVAWIGFAASVALGITIALWSWTPNYSLLYGGLSQQDAVEVVAALQQTGVDYKVDDATGAVMVPSGKLDEVRLNLAGQGLPRSNTMGFELLQQETGFGTSRALEAARFHRALEGELARTIGTLNSVSSARVHLATPKQSVFVRKRKTPSASVVVSLYSGRSLEKGQVDSIVHMVASSVPELDPSRVTVVDQRGRLLSGKGDSREMILSANQFEYTKQLEQHFRQRIEDILTPVLGLGNVRAEVTADVDFTITEQTEERFNPDATALRSEQINEQSSRSAGGAQGVPGALSNQPPAAGTAPEVAGGEEAAGEGGGSGPLSASKRATRNYELDKTISHTRLSTGNLRRLSVAVVVDDKSVVGDDGAVSRVERTPEEISRLTQLVRDSIGFNAQRGDSVQVLNVSFLAPPTPEPLPEVPIWEQAWVWDLAKQVGGVILVLVLILFVLRPTMKRLTAVPAQPELPEGAAGVAGAAGAAGALAGGEEDSLQLPGPERYEDTLDAARRMVQDDPKRVAQVV